MDEPYYRDNNVTVYAGDCLDVLAEIADGSIDAIVTDPPYGLEFMGKDWDAPWKQAGRVLADASDVGGFQDGAGGNPFSRSRIRFGRDGTAMHDFQTWCQQWAEQLLRVLKPGGHIAAFGGTRTWHRLAVAIEDAGFEIRDNLAWLYGSGFPKSMDVSKAIDSAAGKQREIVGRRVHAGFGDRRVGHDGGAQIWSGEIVSAEAITDDANRWQGWGTALKPAFEPIVLARKPLDGTVANNVVAHGTGALNIDACRIGTGGQLKWEKPRNMGYHKGTDNGKCEAQANQLGRWPANVTLDPDAAAELDKQSGIQKDGVAVHKNHKPNTGGYGSTIGYVPGSPDAGYGGEGGASRFFPVFKYNPKASADERPTIDGIAHPTVKPVDLIAWLIRLITPPDGTILDPFAGSGTTGEAAIREHKNAILIEREPDYLPLITQRLTKPIEIGFNFGENA